MDFFSPHFSLLIRPAEATAATRPCARPASGVASRPASGVVSAPASGLVAYATLLIGLTLLTSNGVALGATYKWVDEKGVVHYSDKVPAEALDKGSIELSKAGVPLRRVEPAPTAEQRRAREQEDERKRLLAKQQEEVARRDRALLASYTSEGEIDLARNRAVNTLDAVIQSATAYSERLTKRKNELTQQIAGYKNKQVPAVFEREYENVNGELDRQAELVVVKRKEMVAVAAKYDIDKARWRELSAAKPQAGSAIVSGAATPPGTGK